MDNYATKMEKIRKKQLYQFVKNRSNYKIAKWKDKLNWQMFCLVILHFSFLFKLDEPGL